MLLARVAEQLYWAARYVTRAECMARVVGVHTHLLVDMPTSVPLTWEPLLDIPGLRDPFGERYPLLRERHIVGFLLSDPANPSSVMACVTAARDNLRSSREVLPREAWHAFNDLHLYVASHHAESVDRRHRGRFVDKVVAETQRFSGILGGCMGRDAAYQMLHLGRQLERADMARRVLHVRAVALLGKDRRGSAPTADGASVAGSSVDGASVAGSSAARHDDVQWAAVLRSLAAEQAFRRRPAATSGPAIVEFLLHDPTFPSSIRHCLDEAAATVGTLPRSDAPRAGARSALRALADVAGADADRLTWGLGHLQAALVVLHQQVEATWFPPRPPVASAVEAVAAARRDGSDA